MLKGQSFQKIIVIDHRYGQIKCADTIFFAILIDAVFNTNAGIILGQSCRGNPYQLYPPVEDGSAESGHIQKGSPAHGNDHAMPVYAGIIHVFCCPVHMVPGIFYLLTAGKDHRFPGQANKILVVFKPPGYIIQELGVLVGQPVINHHHHFPWPGLVFTGKGVDENGIAGVKNIPGKADRVMIRLIKCQRDNGLLGVVVL